jgi:serine/threonine protein kinase
MQDAQSDERRRYQIVQTLGKGGFGTVYRARLIGEGGFTKDVALKVLNDDMQAIPEVGSRLRDEGRILGFIRHRAVVQVDGLVKLEGNWTVVMEFIDGCDVFDLVGLGRVPVGCVLEVIGEVAGAMFAAYNAIGPSGQPLRLIHRDIKPGNIQVTRLGEVKLLDFGVARADFEGREAQTRSMRFGSMGYLAPERLDGEDGPGGDVYALAIVACEMLIADRFGQASLKRAKHDAQMVQKLERVRSVIGPKGDGVIELLKQMLSFDPAERPAFRDIEDRCQTLRVQVGGERLRDWSERVVTEVRKRKRKKDEDDERTGAILVEGSVALPKPAKLAGVGKPAVDPPPPARRSGERSSSGRSVWVPVIGCSALILLSTAAASFMIVMAAFGLAWVSR